MIDPRGPIGIAKVDLDTPALLVDLDVMDANIARIVAECREHRVAWRPHSKVHKTPEIAQRLIAAGARGITCAKLGEAEVMAAAGIRDILIANQIVGTTKIGRLIALTSAADPIVAVDSVANATFLSEASSGQGKVLKVVIEVDVGMNRCGVEPGARAAALAAEISGLAGLRFMGLMAWEGHAATIADLAERARRGQGHRSADRERRCLPQGRPKGGDRELRRRRHVPILRAPARRHRSAGGRRDLQRHALPHELPSRLPLRPHGASFGVGGRGMIPSRDDDVLFLPATMMCSASGTTIPISRRPASAGCSASRTRGRDSKRSTARR
jgi:uncharacterized pyridoxal phosphate-containing UPF0001 family protein